MVNQQYKKTEIGTIPTEWKTIRIGEITDAIAGGTPSTLIKEYWGGSIPWMNSGELNLYRVYQVKGRITKKGLDNSSTHIVPPGCVLIGLAGQGKTRGTVAINYIGLCTNQSIAAILPNKFFCSEYLFQNLTNRYYELRDMSSGDGGRGGLNLKIIKNLMCAFPPLEEQKVIADTLCDVDMMIASLEKLIEKKKAIKQDTMQELLTGKRRLKGYSKEWRTESLGKISKINTGDKNNEQKIDGGKYPFFVRSKQVERINTYSYDGEAILVPGEGNIGDIFHYINGKFDWHQRVYKISDFPTSVYTKYVYHQMCFSFGEYALRHTVKATVDSLRLPTFENYIFDIPSSIEEQKAIADVLDDMDNEIFNLEKRLEKVRQIKQGMMEQLLTGKIRLVKSVDATSNKIKLHEKSGSDKPTGHNQQFDDAVVIAGIVNAFYSQKYPLGRKKVQKLLYLMRRKQEADTSAFKKKAAGPYADEIRYKGGEPIANKNGYITTVKSNRGTAFKTGKNIQTALSYIDKWQIQSYIDWLLNNFKYTKTDDLELFATVDMAMCDLINEGKTITVDSIKSLINSNAEWKAKLSKPYFSDINIERAINECRSLL